MQHVRQNAPLRRPRRILDTFCSTSGTIFAPGTMKSRLLDPPEKHTKFRHPFFQFSNDLGIPSGAQKSPRNRKKSTENQQSLKKNNFSSILVDFGFFYLLWALGPQFLRFSIDFRSF
jgi:hypothetical protein